MIEAKTPLTERQQLLDFFVANVSPRPAASVALTVPCWLAEPNMLQPLSATAADSFLQQVQSQCQQGHFSLGDNNNGLLIFQSGACANLHELAARLQAATAAMTAAATATPARLLYYGVQPALPAEMVLQQPALLQADFQYHDEADAVQKMQAALCLQPIALALFANSCVVAGQLQPRASARAAQHEAYDEKEMLLAKLLRQPNFGFCAYVDFLLAQPSKTGAADFMQRLQLGADPAQASLRPTVADWLQHMQDQTHAVRFVPYLTVGGIDAVAPDLAMAYAALLLGILYDDTARRDWLLYSKNWAAPHLRALALEGVRVGLKGTVSLPDYGTQPLAECALNAIKIAQQGLRRRAVRVQGAADESRYLEPLFLMAESAQTPADALRLRLQTRPDGQPLTACL